MTAAAAVFEDWLPGEERLDVGVTDDWLSVLVLTKTTVLAAGAAAAAAVDGLGVVFADGVGEDELEVEPSLTMSTDVPLRMKNRFLDVSQQLLPPLSSGRLPLQQN